MKKKGSMSETSLKCTECGNVNTLFRDSGWRKKDGHIKTVWCFKCKKETDHIENKRGLFEQ